MDSELKFTVKSASHHPVALSHPGEQACVNSVRRPRVPHWGWLIYFLLKKKKAASDSGLFEPHFKSES